MFNKSVPFALFNTNIMNILEEQKNILQSYS